MLSLLLGPKRATRDAGNWHVVSGGISPSTMTQAGTVVNEELALTYAAVWCATRFISESSAGLPFFTYRKKGNDDREFASDYYLYDILKSRPNPDMGSMPFRLGRTINQVNSGNGFAEIEKNAAGEVVNLWPIHACRVRPIDQYHNSDAYRQGFRYAVRNDDNTSTAFKADEMLHVPGVLTEDGVWGKGVITYARESIGLGLGTERHGATFFGGGAQPRGVIEGLNIKDKEQRRTFRSEWKEVHGSPDSGEIALLPMGGKYTPISLSNEDSQFLETRKHNVTEIARWYRVPPHMLMDLERATFSNIEHLSIEAVIYGLMPWLRLWEDQCNLKLIREEDRGEYFVEHQVAGLLRGDINSRMDAYIKALGNGIMTINEVRRLENLNGIGEAGDQHYVQLNMTTAEKLIQEPDPTVTTVQVDEDIEEEEEEEPEEPEEEDTDVDEDEDEYPPAAQAAAKLVLRDALSRMFTKESNAAARIVESKGDFDQWMTDFYGKHKSTLAEALTPACFSMAAFGVAADPNGMAARLIEASKTDLSHAYNSHNKEKFLAYLRTWPTDRADYWANELMDERPCGLL